MKTLAQLQNAFPQLPSWFDGAVVDQSNSILDTNGLLYAVKYIRELSKERDNTLDLSTSKDICMFLREEPTVRLTLSEFKTQLREAFMKGVDFEQERNIDMHTTSIGHKNPYGNMDSTEAYDEFENSTDVQLIIKRFV